MLSKVKAIRAFLTVSGILYAYEVANADGVTATYSVSGLKKMMGNGTIDVKNLDLVSDAIQSKEGCPDKIEPVRHDDYYALDRLHLSVIASDLGAKCVEDRYVQLRKICFRSYKKQEDIDSFCRTSHFCGPCVKKEINPGLHAILHCGEDLYILFQSERLLLPESCISMFAGLRITGEIDFTNVSGERVKDISGMFCCSQIEEVDLRNLGMHSIRHMYRAFDTDCSAKISLKGVDTSAVAESSELYFSESNVTSDDIRIGKKDKASNRRTCDYVYMDENGKPFYYLIEGYAYSMEYGWLYEGEEAVAPPAAKTSIHKTGAVKFQFDPAPMELLPARVVCKADAGKTWLRVESDFSRENSAEASEYLDISAFFSGVTQFEFCACSNPECVWRELIYSENDFPVHNRSGLSEFNNRCIRLKKLGTDTFAFVLESEAGKNGRKAAVRKGFIAAKASKFIMSPAVEKCIKDTLQIEELEGEVTVLPEE